MIKFGTDGWRAVIAEDFTFENIKIVSQAIADYLLPHQYIGGGGGQKTYKGIKRVVIGYDCRFLSDEFAGAVAGVLAANDIKVVLSDSDVPTPAVSFHAKYHKYDLGIMITASHNPARFNGLKIKTKEGGAADKSLTDQVEKLLYKTKPKFMEEEEALKKKLLSIENFTFSYVDFLKNFVDVGRIRRLRLKMLVDIMYGTGDNYVERILGKSGIRIDYINNEFNPSFGGIHPEPVEANLQELIKKVRKEKYDLGVALDGDADRIAVVDNKGNFINAQIILPLLAIHMIKNRKEKGGIGKTVVGSNVIDEVASALKVVCYETAIGFKYISNLFKEGLICIGGEEAGGIGVKGYIPERDGSVAFLLLLEMMALENKNFDELLADFYKKYGRWYYHRTAIPVKSVKKKLEDMKLPGELLGKKVERVNTLDGIKMITKDSWLMLRQSGTEPIVRVYAESKTKKEAQMLVDSGKKMIYAL